MAQSVRRRQTLTRAMTVHARRPVERLDLVARRGVRRIGRGLLRAWRALVRQRLRAMPWGQGRLTRRLRPRIPISTMGSGPLVSLVVIASPGAPATARWLASIERTTYRPIELVIVSEDEVHAATPMTIRQVRPTTPGDLGASIGDALAVADGALACVLDPAVEPVFPDWLGHLVETLEAGPVGVGATILRAAGRGPVTAAQRSGDLSVLSAGVDFGRSGGAIRPRYLAFGQPYRPPVSQPADRVPALSLACLLARRSDLSSAAGSLAGYAGGPIDSSAVPYADADLALRLRSEGGVLACDRRSLVWYAVDEPAPADRTIKRKRDVRDDWVTSGDAGTFLERWGPRLARLVLSDVIRSTHRWSVAPLRIVSIGDVPLTSRACTAAGWHLADPSGGRRAGSEAPEVDVVIVADTAVDVRTLPSGLIRVAWVTTTAPRHLDDFDLVLAATESDRDRLAAATSKRVALAAISDQAGVEALREALVGWVADRRIGIRIGPRNWSTAGTWGDLYFGRSLQHRFEHAGYPTRLRLRSEWSSAAAARDDATVHLFGLHAAHNRPSQANVLWQISHPDLASPALYDSYDHVFVASDAFAASMAAMAHVPVEPLHQATDPERFYPDAGGPRHELLYVANYREQRKIVDWLIPTTRDLAIYGNRWLEHGLDPRWYRGSFIPNEDLRRYYGSASIVLNDTWEDMRRAGFISNRIYDALACGAFVLSDEVLGLDDEFDGGVAVYRDADDLRASVEHYLDDPGLRRDIAARGRAAVLARHTFEARARAIIAALGPLLDRRPDL